jgi:hypothetical protein
MEKLHFDNLTYCSKSRRWLLKKKKEPWMRPAKKADLVIGKPHQLIVLC